MQQQQQQQQPPEQQPQDEVLLPAVRGVPEGQVLQLALLPCVRPACGVCFACAAGGDCMVLSALRRWDDLLPGLPLDQLAALKQQGQRCGRCRGCVLRAAGGGRGRRRRGGNPCLALSRVRVGRLATTVQQLEQQRQQWAAAQQQRLAGPATAVASGGRQAASALGSSSSGNSGDSSSGSEINSEDSNRSLAWQRELRQRKQPWMQPLPAPDGSLPLPLVPGVSWQRMCQLAESWGEGAPPRCGHCAACLQQQQQRGGGMGEEEDDEDEEGEEVGEEARAGPGAALRCSAAAALRAWDRQLGPVTTAAVQAVAAALEPPPLPRRQQGRGQRQGQAWCRLCRQCSHGQQQACSAGVPAACLSLSLCCAVPSYRTAASQGLPSPSQCCPFSLLILMQCGAYGLAPCLRGCGRQRPRQEGLQQQRRRRRQQGSLAAEAMRPRSHWTAATERRRRARRRGAAATALAGLPVAVGGGGGGLHFTPTTKAAVAAQIGAAAAARVGSSRRHGPVAEIVHAATGAAAALMRRMQLLLGCRGCASSSGVGSDATKAWTATATAAMPLPAWMRLVDCCATAGCSTTGEPRRASSPDGMRRRIGGSSTKTCGRPSGGS